VVSTIDHAGKWLIKYVKGDLKRNFILKLSRDPQTLLHENKKV